MRRARGGSGRLSLSTKKTEQCMIGKTNAYQIFTYWRLLMSVIPKITCRRCGREYSGLRSRCPYCGTGRSKSAERIPLRTSRRKCGHAGGGARRGQYEVADAVRRHFAPRGRGGRHRAHHREPERQSKWPELLPVPTPPATVSSAAPVATPTPEPRSRPRRRRRLRRSRASPSRSSAASARSLRAKVGDEVPLEYDDLSGRRRPGRHVVE